MASARRANITRKVQTIVDHRPAEAVKKILLGGNTQTVFYVYFASILMAGAEILIIEVKLYKIRWAILLVTKSWLTVKWKRIIIILNTILFKE